MARLRPAPFHEPLAERLSRARNAGVSLYWLGQAGFVIDAGGRRIVIDPYLSDTLAAKYAGTAFPHQRMMPAPILPEQLGAVDLVLVTHHHTDHMDGETLKALADRLRQLQFVVPKAAMDLAIERIGVAEKRLICVDAGDDLNIHDIGIHVLRAAHETLERDARGNHRFLGYGLAFPDCRIVHSGDTVPFDGQEQELRDFAPDVALLPVNGRSPELAEAGFAGNLMLDEAVGLCERVGIGSMIAHHYGMFAFNTAAPERIDALAKQTPIQLIRAKMHEELHIAPAEPKWQ
jgi:L-ascorbate metabolism protein UlaG (beta-lactamase superfamily)